MTRILYAVHLPDATPPLVLTADPVQAQTWLDAGATEVYELAAVQTFPATEPEPPVDEPPAETPEETTT